MNLIVSKIDEVLFSGEAVSVTVPGIDGILTILTHHMPLITTLKKGEVLVKVSSGATSVFPVEHGILEVGKEGTTILL